VAFGAQPGREGRLAEAAASCDGLGDDPGGGDELGIAYIDIVESGGRMTVDLVRLRVL